jgi:hypothetical protein
MQHSTSVEAATESRKKGAPVKMRRLFKTLVGIAAVTTVSLPATARAEGYVNPWAGAVVASSNDVARKGFHSFGVSAGDTGSLLGLDVNFGYNKDFYGKGTDTKVIDFMGGVTAGPLLGTGAYGARPYVAGGVGLLRTSIGSLSDNNFGFNVGGGLFAYFSNHLGLRGEVRYYRTANGGDLGDFNFTRAQIGIVLR